MIDPKKKSIKDILSDSEISYKVPSYQRSYDWGKEELGEFLDDLEASSKNQEKNLFLGNFIFDVSNQNMIEIIIVLVIIWMFKIFYNINTAAVYKFK